MFSTYDVSQHHGGIPEVIKHSKLQSFSAETTLSQKDMQNLMHRSTDEYRKRLNWTRTTLDDWKIKRLAILVDWAFKTSAFYNELYRKSGYSPGEIRSLRDFECLPTITRNDLANSFRSIMSSRYEIGKCRLAGSSGSSGQPVQMVLSQHRANLDMLQKYRMMEFMMGKALDPNRWIYNIHHAPWWHSSVLGCYRTFTVNQDCHASHVVEHLKILKPQVISTLGSYMPALAHTASACDLNYVQLITTNSETTTQAERDQWEARLNIPVRDEYSSEELDIIAMQCTNKNYHIVEDNVHLEQSRLDSYGLGEVIGTDLWNMAMPIIRYLQGDLIEPYSREHQCPCGCVFKTFKKIHGRMDQALKTRSGDRIPPGSILDAIERYFYQMEAPLTELRLVQTSTERIEVFHVTRALCYVKKELFISFQQHLSDLFGYAVIVIPKQVSSLPTALSFKRRTVICLC